MYIPFNCKFIHTVEESDKNDISKDVQNEVMARRQRTQTRNGENGSDTANEEVYTAGNRKPI